MRDALPGATFLGFTGTPIESSDKSTRAVFGDYIDVYDLTRAVEDGATVKIFYESRLAKVALSDDDTSALDELADEITEQVEEDEASKAKSKWARLEAIVGAEERLDLIAADIVEHWEKRREAMLGKAMIVTMSRRIAVALYEKIVALRPDWHSDDPTPGQDQGRHDRLGRRPAGVPAAPPLQGRPQATSRRAPRTPTTRWSSSSSATCG